MMFNVLFITLFFFPNAHSDEINEPQIETAFSDSVTTEMILRPEDIFWQTDWDFFSTDRISFKVNAGRFGYYGPQPTFLLDGIPFDPTFFGMNYSQLFPVPSNQIGRITSESEAGVLDGVSHYSGIMELQSVPVKDGISISSSTQFGHNTNEPGPWVFDRDNVTPNIDRFGHLIDGGISLKFRNWYSKGHFMSHSFLNMNPFVQTRIRNLIALPDKGEWPDGRSTTHLGLAETGIESDRVDFRVQGILSESDDFVFLQPLAREVPTTFQTSQLSAAGRFSISDAIGIRAMVQYREKGTGYRENRLEENFDWNQESKTGRASLYFHSKKSELDIGSEYKIINTEASGINENENEQTFLNLFWDQRLQLFPGIRFGSFSSVTLHEEDKPLQLRGNLEFDLTGGWTISFGGEKSELLPEFVNPLDSWIRNGYNLLDRFNVDYFIPEEISNTKLTILSHWQEFTVAERFKTKLEVQYLDHQSLNIPFQDSFYYLQLSTRPGGYFLIPETSGQRLKISLKTKMNWSARLQQTAGIYAARTLEGDVAYKSYWKTIPDYMFRHSTVFKPYPDLEIQLNLQYQTQAVWDEYRRLDGKMNRTFNIQFPFQFFRFKNELSPGLNMDLVFSKWFWEQRLRAVFLLNNLFNEEYQTHPIGAMEGFGYFVRLELRI